MREQNKKACSSDWIFKNNLVNDKDKEIIKRLVVEKKNLLITGNTQTGKTSLMNWIANILNSDERIIMFDFYSEIKSTKHLNKLFKIGYRNDADIIGNPSIMELGTLIEKSLILPFDRLLTDELLGESTEKLLDTIYEGRSVIFSITSNNALNALKTVYLSTIYPENKELPKEKKIKICNTFEYAITLGNETIIEEIKLINEEIVFKKIN